MTLLVENIVNPTRFGRLLTEYKKDIHFERFNDEDDLVKQISQSKRRKRLKWINGMNLSTQLFYFIISHFSLNVKSTVP